MWKGVCKTPVNLLRATVPTADSWNFSYLHPAYAATVVSASELTCCSWCTAVCLTNGVSKSE